MTSFTAWNAYQNYEEKIDMNETEEHPSFILAKSLDEPWREHFPKNQKEASRMRLAPC